MSDKQKSPAPSSTGIEQRKEELPSVAREGDAPLDEQDKTIADSFPASDPPASY